MAPRTLRLAPAARWLLDAVPQYQNFMFSQGFPRMLAATAAGNPGIVLRLGKEQVKAVKA